MFGFQNGWRRLCGMFAVILLATVVAGAPTEALLCRDDGKGVVAAGQQTAFDTHHFTQPDGAGDPSDDGGQAPDSPAGDCPDGHCHHGGTDLFASFDVPGAKAFTTTRPPLAFTQVAIAHASFPQIRPPRA